MMIRSPGVSRLAAVGFALVVLLAWHVLTRMEWISPLFFPSPLRTIDAWLAMAADGRITAAGGATALRMFKGWLLASALGIVLGALIASSRWSRAMCGPLLEFLRPLPASAIIPVAILAFGLSDNMATAVVAFGSIWPVLLAAVHGFGHVDDRLTEVADVLEMGVVERFWTIQLPAAMADILAGARIGLAIALILAVVTEMQASLPGLGQTLLMAQRSFRTPELYAGVLTLGLLGYGASSVLRMAERRLMRWRS